jgi:hypothetical protein
MAGDALWSVRLSFPAIRLIDARTMVAQTRPPEPDRPWWRRTARGKGANSPSNSPRGSGGNSPENSAEGSVDLQPGGSPGRLPGTSPGAYAVQVVGGSVFDVEIDGIVTRSATDYAIALIEFLKGPEHHLLHGRYVSVRSLEERHLPDFLETSGWPPISWRSVSVALGRLAKAGKVTKRRDAEFRFAAGGKPRSVAQFLIPRPT